MVAHLEHGGHQNPAAGVVHGQALQGIAIPHGLHDMVWPVKTWCKLRKQLQNLQKKRKKNSSLALKVFDGFCAKKWGHWHPLNWEALCLYHLRSTSVVETIAAAIQISQTAVAQTPVSQDADELKRRTQWLQNKGLGMLLGLSSEKAYNENR